MAIPEDSLKKITRCINLNSNKSWKLSWKRHQPTRRPTILIKFYGVTYINGSFYY